MRTMATSYEKRTPDSTSFGHCTVCGGPADHVHMEHADPGPKSHLVARAEVEKVEKAAVVRREKFEAMKAAAHADDPEPESEDDIVIEVELEPELVAAYQAADETPDPEPQDETRRVPKRARPKAKE